MVTHIIQFILAASNMAQITISRNLFTKHRMLHVCMLANACFSALLLSYHAETFGKHCETKINTPCKVTTLPFCFMFVHRHHHRSSLPSRIVSRGWAKTSACRLQVSMYCAVLCQIVSLQYLSRSALRRLAGLPLCIFLSYGIREVHRSFLRRMMGLAQGDLIFLTLLIKTFVLCLPQRFAFLSLYNVCDVEHTSFFQFWSGWPQVCPVLVC